ncbi:hypothetical protein C6P08_02505 [Weissella confusa]|uniref:hypothetical protein n=1 Tax=Weissella confusa TaxID=1583 RepID=UPI00109213A5|nr:hypothetical protein [Weissella confusa]MBJ7694123.1 hypothetical protein [Weissella confusa]QBZ04125.1 hypothetical protein C6P08_02505 [Weissella confusa]
MQLPHDLVGWLSVIGSFLAGLGFIIKFTFVRSFDKLSNDIRDLTAKLGHQDDRLDKHELHLVKHDE